MYRARGDNRTHCKCKLKFVKKLTVASCMRRKINYYYYYYYLGFGCKQFRLEGDARLLAIQRLQMDDRVRADRRADDGNSS